jgi:hypothetical protein
MSSGQILAQNLIKSFLIFVTCLKPAYAIWKGLLSAAKKHIINVKIAVLLRSSEAEADREVEHCPTVEKLSYSDLHNRTQRDY